MDQSNIGPSRPASNGSWPSRPSRPSSSPNLSDPMQPLSVSKLKPLLWSFKARLQGKLKALPESVDHTQIVRTDKDRTARIDNLTEHDDKTEHFTSWKHPGHWIVPNRNQYEAWFTDELAERLMNHQSELQTCFCVFVISEAEQMLPTNGLNKRPTDDAYFEWVLRRIFARVVVDQIIDSILEKCQSHGVPPANCMYILKYPINMWISQITEFLMQDSELCDLAHSINAPSNSGRGKASSSAFVNSRADFLPGVEHLSNPLIRSVHSVHTGSVDMPLPSLRSLTPPESSAVRADDTRGVEPRAAPTKQDISPLPPTSQTYTPPRSSPTRADASEAVELLAVPALQDVSSSLPSSSQTSTAPEDAMLAVESLIEPFGRRASSLLPISSQTSTALGDATPAVEPLAASIEQQDFKNQNQQPERPKPRKTPSRASTRIGIEPPPQSGHARRRPPKNASKYSLMCQLTYLEYSVQKIRDRRAQRKVEGLDVPDEKPDPQWTIRERMSRFEKWFRDYTKPDEPQDGSIMGHRELTQDDLHLIRVAKRTIKALLVKLDELERLERADQNRVREADRSGRDNEEEVDDGPRQNRSWVTNDDAAASAATPQTSNESQSARDRLRSLRRRMGLLPGHGSAQRLTEADLRSRFSD